MSDATYKFEPGLDMSVPRKVRVRAGLAVLVAAAVVMVAVMFAFGFASLLEAGRLMWLSKAGTSTTATVTALYYGTSRELTYDDSRLQQISAFEYQFALPSGVTITSRAPVALSRSMMGAAPVVAARPRDSSAAVVPALPPPLRYLPGRSMVVRYALFGGHVVSRPWEKAPWGHVAFLLASGFLLLAIAILIARSMLGRIASSYRLVRDGLVSVGIILTKKAVSEDTTRYYVTFAESPKAAADTSTGAKPVEWTRPCSAQQFLTFEPDQLVTLIAPTGKPDETTLFRLLPFGK